MNFGDDRLPHTGTVAWACPPGGNFRRLLRLEIVERAQTDGSPADIRVLNPRRPTHDSRMVHLLRPLTAFSGFSSRSYGEAGVGHAAHAAVPTGRGTVTVEGTDAGALMVVRGVTQAQR